MYTDNQQDDLQHKIHAMRNGGQGEARQFACNALLDFAAELNVNQFIRVKHAHLVGSYWSGAANIQLLNQLVASKAEFSIPTTLNASSACLNRYGPSDIEEQNRANATVEQLAAMGADATLTCAPYHLPIGLAAGDNVAWAESNAVVYANSVMGLRTNKTPQYLDMMAALCGFMPKYGFYTDRGRQPTLLIDCQDTHEWDDFDYQIFGLWLGAMAKSGTPLITSRLNPTNDQLRAVGANASASGNVSLFYWSQQLSKYSELDYPTPLVNRVYSQQQRQALLKQYRWQGEPVEQIRIGTPHASIDELKQLLVFFQHGGKPSQKPFFVSTSRYNQSTFHDQCGVDALSQYNIHIIVDTCTYYQGPLPVPSKNALVLTTSGKWALYARANLNITAKIASLAECVAVAVGE